MLLLLVACSASPDSADTTSSPDDSDADTGTPLSLPATVTGFDVPESVLWDEARDRYLVSNVSGSASKEDGVGFLSVVAPDGTVSDLAWVEGLDAPKGSAVSGDFLWVADIDELRRVHPDDGTLVDSVVVEDARFLNDVTPDGQGGVYVSDSAGSADIAVWHVAGDGTVAAWSLSSDAGAVNGVLYDNGVLYGVADAELLTFNAFGGVAERATVGPDSLDGLVRNNDGALCVSSWTAAAVLCDTGAGFVTEVTGQTSPADIGYDATRGRVLIPRFDEGMIVIDAL